MNKILTALLLISILAISNCGGSPLRSLNSSNSGSGSNTEDNNNNDSENDSENGDNSENTVITDNFKMRFKTSGTDNKISFQVSSIQGNSYDHPLEFYVRDGYQSPYDAMGDNNIKFTLTTRMLNNISQSSSSDILNAITFAGVDSRDRNVLKVRLDGQLKKLINRQYYDWVLIELSILMEASNGEKAIRTVNLNLVP